jgi:Mn-dependent DtxR family transcriptional regulator
VVLTQPGHRIALELIRRHRLVEPTWRRYWTFRGVKFTLKW